MKMEFSLEGTVEAERLLEEIAREAIPVGLQSLMRSAEQVMTRSKNEFCPVDTGALRATGMVSSEVQGNVVNVILGYGGSALDYAVVVHETNRKYRGGKSWKYLQIPLQEALPDINRAMAEDYNKMLQRK
jgi:hypothetical protein